ncbi:MAG: DUF1778 domain-containing protein [Deferribacteraceae bacterium]|jgi:uncharacterized protein (DUF1778 family)|nr:DUF1778 domain-containing protein [Deferribacteraceae bacterium]
MPIKARLDAKIPVEVKERLEFVANLESRSLTDVVISAINSYSEKAIMQHKLIKLSIKDQEMLAAHLLNEDVDIAQLNSRFAYLKLAIDKHDEYVEEL